MQSGNIQIFFDEIIDEDKPVLSDVINQSFDDDSRKHPGGDQRRHLVAIIEQCVNGFAVTKKVRDSRLWLIFR